MVEIFQKNDDYFDFINNEMNSMYPSSFKDSNSTNNYPVYSEKTNFPGIDSDYKIEDKNLNNQETERKNHTLDDKKEMIISLNQGNELLRPSLNEKYNGVVGRIH